MIQQNSIDAFELLESKGILNQREKEILKIRLDKTGPMRDWDYLQIYKPGSDNINLVQPRITNMIDLKIFTLGPTGRSPYIDSPVRTTVLNPKYEPDTQRSLF